jgi:hypothetical protein
MPVHALHAIKAGTTSKSLLVYARGAGGQGAGVTGLTATTRGASAAYVREDGEVVPVPLSEGATGSWVAGSFGEVDPELVPGVYRFGVPDGALARGSSTRTLVMLRFPGAEIDPIEIDLVAYDPQDERCIGLAHLDDRLRHKFLRRALPRLTEQELEAGEPGEEALARRAADAHPAD